MAVCGTLACHTLCHAACHTLSALALAYPVNSAMQRLCDMLEDDCGAVMSQAVN